MNVLIYISKVGIALLATGLSMMSALQQASCIIWLRIATTTTTTTTS
jgi:hypothetical protein